MRTHKKALSVLLGSAMLLSSVSFLSGCNSAKAAKKITSDSLWYDNTTIEAQSSHEGEELEFGYYYDNCVYEDKIFTSFEGYHAMPNTDSFDDDYAYSSLAINELIEYDMEGNILFSRDISNIIGDGWLRTIYADDNGINLIITSYNVAMNYKESHKVVTFNVENEEFSEPKDLNLGTDSENQTVENLIPLSNGALLASIYTYEGDEPSYIFNVIEDGEIVKTVDFSKEFNQIIYDMQTFFNDDEGNLLSLGSASEGTLVYKLDINTYEVTDITPENAFELDAYSYSPSSDGCLYKVDEEGIKKLNTTSFEEELVLPFNSCNVNLYDITSNYVISASEDAFVLAGMRYTESGSNIFSITKLTKADKNPNAGKLQLVIGLVDTYMDESLADAIYEYNETGTECFASVKSYNTYVNFDYRNGYPDEEYQKAYINAAATMTNDLSIELMSGEGPDIIMGAASYSQLNNSDYLKDLKDLVGELDSSSYFMNVFDAAKTGDKIYQIPLSFQINGIACEPKYAPSNGIGFTLPEYIEFVDKVCNGSDPNMNDRSTYFINGISQMSDLFLDSDNNKVNFSQDAFYEFAEYCLNNVPETINWDEWMVHDIVDYGSDESSSEPYATTAYLYGLTSYGSLTVNGTKEIGIYGVGVDGRGPCINIGSSVAISATTVSTDGALEFVRLLLSDDVQLKLAESYSNCVNKNALYDACLKIIEDSNEIYEEYRAMHIAEIQIMSWGVCKLDESMIDDYFDALNQGSYISTIDPAIASIVMEEIPAYFAGQKSIEDVAAIIDNRAQTVLNER